MVIGLRNLEIASLHLAFEGPLLLFLLKKTK